MLNGDSVLFSPCASDWIASIPFLAGILGVLVGGRLSNNLVRWSVSAITVHKVLIVSGAAQAACFVAPIPFMLTVAAVQIQGALRHRFDEDGVQSLRHSRSQAFLT
ncbi:hypothetical protein NB694_002438 [Pantoea ananatis]|nr:hypothetical protein [Pantoea ananatis]